MNLKKITISMSILGCSFIANAQLMTNNNVLISLTSSAQLTIKGDLLNNSGTTILNDATIDLNGNWTNNSGNNCFGTSQGTVILNGNNQAIGGSNQTVFNNLGLSGGTKTLQVATTVGGGNLIPGGILNCNNAIVDLNSNLLTINNPNNNAVSATSGYILSEDADNSSKVTWKIGTNTGIHNIPFGNTSGTQIPFSVSVTTGNLGDITVSTYQTVPNNTPLPVSPTMVSNMLSVTGAINSANMVDRFWQIDKSGSGIASYTFNYAPVENAANGNTGIRAQCWNNSTLGWESALPGQINPTTQSVMVPGVNKSGAWALTLPNSPLPIELLTFSATAEGKHQIICNWNTAAEINNDYFTVMRSKDGFSFEEAGKVDGAGNSTENKEYTFNDLKPFKGLSYYRLKQTDFNGEVSFSKIVSVFLTDDEIKYTVFPNPSGGTFFIQYKAEENTGMRYTIADASGRLVCGGSLTDLSGIQQINLPGVMKGFYFLKITQGDHSDFQKLEVIND